jgi:hypothetical protein
VTGTEFMVELLLTAAHWAYDLQRAAVFGAAALLAVAVTVLAWLAVNAWQEVPRG